MKNHRPSASATLANAVIAAVLLGLGAGAGAQNAPGTDPIVLPGKITFSGLPLPQTSGSKPLDPSTDLPAWLQAKISRFEAKAYTSLEGGDGTVHTDRDVVSRQTGNALQRTCTTDVASNTYTPGAGPTARFGPGGKDQIAVLRGDVITICK